MPITHSVKRKRREKGKPKKEMSCYQSDCSALYSDEIDVVATRGGGGSLLSQEKKKIGAIHCFAGKGIAAKRLCSLGQLS